MPKRSIDTNPEAEKFLISLIRDASIAKRASIMRSLSETTIYLARRAIKRANPDVTELELNLLFVAVHYGKSLSDRLREYLVNRDSK